MKNIDPKICTRDEILSQLRGLRFDGSNRRRCKKLPPEKLESIKSACLAAIRNNITQREIITALNASRSCVSRWCFAAIKEAGDNTEFRLLNLRNRTTTQRLWSRIDVRGADDCWPWLGGMKANGYGCADDNGKKWQAHRLVFATLVADIPDGIIIDHKCKNRGCVNPRHLQLATNSENIYFARMRNAR